MVNDTEKARCLLDIISNGKVDNQTEYISQARHLKKFFKFIKLPEHVYKNENSQYILKNTKKEILRLSELKTSIHAKRFTHYREVPLSFYNLDDDSKNSNDEFFEFVDLAIDFINKNGFQALVDPDVYNILEHFQQIHPIYSALRDINLTAIMSLQSILDRKNYFEMTNEQCNELNNQINHVLKEIKDKIDECFTSLEN